MPGPILPTRWVIAAGDANDESDIFPFLAGRSFAALKTPVWSSLKPRSVSGRERSRALWSYPLWKFRFPHEVLRDDANSLELQRLINFFNSKSGGAIAFFYLDRDDNQVSNSQFGVGDGSTKTFQLNRTTTIGSITFSEPIRGVYGSPTVLDNGAAAGAYTIGTLGQITFTTAPLAGHLLTWSGSFFFLVRFDADELDLSQLAKGYWQGGPLDFSSFKP